MAYIPQFYQASTHDVANKSIEAGIMKYPALCFVAEDSSLVWVSQAGSPENISSIDAITDVKYTDGTLYFYNRGTILYEVKIGASEESMQSIVDMVIQRLDLGDYPKTTEVIQMMENKIGEIGDSENVVDYIKGLSYDNLANVPIIQLRGGLTDTINLSEQNDGVYKVYGQYMIGGNYTTVHSSGSESIFLVEHASDHVAITKITGQSILIYNIFSDDSYVSTKYVTEDWINTQDFMTATQVREYVTLSVRQIVLDVLDEVLDEKVEQAVDRKIGEIDSIDIQNIFI